MECEICTKEAEKNSIVCVYHSICKVLKCHNKANHVVYSYFHPPVFLCEAHKDLPDDKDFIHTFKELLEKEKKKTEKINARENCPKSGTEEFDGSEVFDHLKKRVA